MHVEVDEFHKYYSKLEPTVTLEVLKKQVQKGTIGIDNKQIRPTPFYPLDSGTRAEGS